MGSSGRRLPRRGKYSVLRAGRNREQHLRWKKRRDTFGWYVTVRKPSLCLLADGRGDGEKRKGICMERENLAKAEDVRICGICGKMIIGEYDYNVTKRRTKIYFHKGMKCRKNEGESKGQER